MICLSDLIGVLFLGLLMITLLGYFSLA